MKKVVLLFILLIMPFNVSAMSASSAIAYDLDNDYIFYEKNADEEKLIASITKIMTAIVTIEYGDLDKEVTVGDEILKSFGSAIYIELGEKLTIRDLLYGLMLRSGNDAAAVIAKNVAKDMKGFVYLMNETADKIGMKNTNFVNNHGLEENDGSANKSTARDMAILTKYAYQNETFREIFGTKEYTLKTNYKTYHWVSKNKLIHKHPFITGGKTGFTIKARRTLVTTGSQNNINVVIVTLNDGNDFLDHENMYKDIFKNYESVKVLNKKNLKIKGEEVYKNSNLFLDEDIYITVKPNEKKDIHIEYKLYKDRTFDDHDIIGYANIYLKDKIIRKEPIYIEVDKEKKLSLWEKFKGWIKW